MTTAPATATPAPIRPIRWPIMPQPAAFAQFRQQHPADAADSQPWRRWARAAHLYYTGAVGPDHGGWRMVLSQSQPGEFHTVIAAPDGERCECGDAVWRDTRWCKHVLACYIAQTAEQAQRQEAATA